MFQAKHFTKLSLVCLNTKKKKYKKQMHLVKNEGRQYLVTLWLFVMPMPIVLGYPHFPYLNTVTRVV